MGIPGVTAFTFRRLKANPASDNCHFA